jgi:hypothetical protein
MSDDRDWIDELYAEGRDEPPAALDAAVLAAARDNATRPWYRDIRRLTTVATAAGFLLAALVVIYDPAPERRSVEPAKDEAAATGLTRHPVSPAPEAAPRPAADAQVSLPAEAPVSPSPAPPAQKSRLVTAETRMPAAGVTEPTRQAQTGTSDSAVRTERLTAGNEMANRNLVGETLSHAEPTQAAAADAMEADRPDTAPDPGRAAAALEARCGSLPGTPETRTLATDSLGWYVAVRTDEDTRYYRCDEEQWQEFDTPAEAPSEQEQPDPQDDE